MMPIQMFSIQRSLILSRIVKNLFAEINYAFRLSTSNAEQLSYNRNDDGKYSALDTLYSTHYNFDVTTNTGGAALKYNGKKIVFGAGTDIASTNFDQKDLLTRYST